MKTPNGLPSKYYPSLGYKTYPVLEGIKVWVAKSSLSGHIKSLITADALFLCFMCT